MAKTAEDIIQGIDFPQLKEQKKALLEEIDFVESTLGSLAVVSEVKADLVKERMEKLKGIVNLIDNIQDFAVDVLGKDENEVFNLTGE